MIITNNNCHVCVLTWTPYIHSNVVKLCTVPLIIITRVKDISASGVKVKWKSKVFKANLLQSNTFNLRLIFSGILFLWNQPRSEVSTHSKYEGQEEEKRGCWEQWIPKHTGNRHLRFTYFTNNSSYLYITACGWKTTFYRDIHSISMTLSLHEPGLYLGVTRQWTNRKQVNSVTTLELHLGKQLPTQGIQITKLLFFVYLTTFHNYVVNNKKLNDCTHP